MFFNFNVVNASCCWNLLFFYSIWNNLIFRILCMRRPPQNTISCAQNLQAKNQQDNIYWCRCWADCIFVAQAVDEVSNLLRIWCGGPTWKTSDGRMSHLCFGVLLVKRCSQIVQQLLCLASCLQRRSPCHCSNITFIARYHQIMRDFCCHVIPSKCFSICWIPKNRDA